MGIDAGCRSEGERRDQADDGVTIRAQASESGKKTGVDSTGGNSRVNGK